MEPSIGKSLVGVNNNILNWHNILRLIDTAILLTLLGKSYTLLQSTVTYSPPSLLPFSVYSTKTLLSFLNLWYTYIEIYLIPIKLSSVQGGDML